MPIIHCPLCKKPISITDAHAGLKFSCPHCTQRIQAPGTPPPPVVPTQKTMLASAETEPATPPPFVPPSSHGPPPPTPAMIARSQPWQCPVCSNTQPYFDTRVSQQGWIAFAVLLVLFFPICWLGLLQKEKFVVCGKCGAQQRAS